MELGRRGREGGYGTQSESGHDKQSCVAQDICRKMFKSRRRKTEKGG